MSHAKAIVLGLAVSLMLAASASAIGVAQESPAQIRDFTGLAQKIDLADAVASAESGMKGKVVYIHFVEPEGQLVYPNYAAVLLSDGKLISVDVDPITGIASMPNKMAKGSAAALEQQQRIAEALKRPRSSLQQAIDAAQRREAGRAIDAWLTEWRGKPAYTIGVVRAGQVRTVTIDPMNDQALWQSEPATLSMPGRTAQ